MGTTTGSWTVLNANYHNTGGKQFISKLKPDLTGYIYSTVFGTNSVVPNISPTAFLVDRCENVYVSGWGGLGNTTTGYTSSGTLNLPVTANASSAGSPNTDGSDFYFFVMERNAQSQLFGSFIGQRGGNYPDHVDGGTSRFDKNGIIYQAVCANCNGPAGIFPTSAGVWSPDNGSLGAGAGACNLAAIKIRFDLAGVAAGIQSAIKGRIRDTSGCVPTTAFFKDTVELAKQYIWDFNDGSPQQSTTADTISHVFQSVGFYKVMMIGIDSNSCNISDTSYVMMRIRNDEASLSLTGNKLPPCTSLTYQFTNTSIAPAGKPFKANSFRIDFGDGTSQVMGLGAVTHNYSAIGTYNIGLVLVDTSYCNQADSAAITIRIAPNVKAQFITPALGCVPYTAVFNNVSVGGTDFAWGFGDGTTSTQVNPSHLYTNTGNYTIKLVATDTATCNKVDSTSFTINVNVKPVAGFSAAPQPPKSNTAIIFTNLSTGGVSYKWFFGDGDSILSNSMESVSHIYNSSGTFNACLIVFNAAGCSDTVCQNVTAIIIPLYDVPNAFSPNGDGVNDKIFVRGFGINKMKWNIYNRWGTLVFESSDKNVGWDGYYKGALQAQDVYHYVLQIEMTNGAKYLKNGDITLLR
jgi:gliding motility-associated-like protein